MNNSEVSRDPYAYKTKATIINVKEYNQVRRHASAVLEVAYTSLSWWSYL